MGPPHGTVHDDAGSANGNCTWLRGSDLVVCTLHSLVGRSQDRFDKGGRRRILHAIGVGREGAGGARAQNTMNNNCECIKSCVDGWVGRWLDGWMDGWISSLCSKERKRCFCCSSSNSSNSSCIKKKLTMEKKKTHIAQRERKDRIGLPSLDFVSATDKFPPGIRTQVDEQGWAGGRLAFM